VEQAGFDGGVLVDADVVARVALAEVDQHRLQLIEPIGCRLSVVGCDRQLLSSFDDS